MIHKSYFDTFELFSVVFAQVHLHVYGMAFHLLSQYIALSYVDIRHVRRILGPGTGVLKKLGKNLFRAKMIFLS